MTVVAALAAAGYFTRPSGISSAPRPIVKTVQKAFTLDRLLAMAPEELAGVDIAEMNLLCATGLPGAEALDVPRCLGRLDAWAERVRAVTQRHLYRAHDPRWADHYKHSENWLRVEFLAQVLQEDCGVRYNMERVRNIDFGSSKDLFIHGMIDDANGGTCASMPVLHVAVGRRLGYPLRLVLTKGHVFCRWDDGQERFNIESTGEGGTDSYPDEHYKVWPMVWTEAERKADCYLKSLSPAEELACFLGSRGHCLLDTGHAKEALATYAAARRLAPEDPAYPSWMRMAQGRLPGHRDPLAEVEYLFARQEEAARREWLFSYGTRVPGMPPLYGPRAPQPYAPQLPLPYGPRGTQPPGPYGPRPGVPQPYPPAWPRGPQPSGPGRVPGEP